MKVFIHILLCSVVFMNVGVLGQQSVPFCECVDASIDCSDNDRLNTLVQTLQQIFVTCLNGCLQDCQTNFYPLHAYHELCPGFGGDAGALYHDLSLECQICDAGHLGGGTGAPCPQVDCADLADQNSLVSVFTSEPCLSDCSANSTCTDAWNRLSAYHESCPEENLSIDVVDQYHDIEIGCPPECALAAGTALSTPVVCASP